MGDTEGTENSKVTTIAGTAGVNKGGWCGVDLDGTLAYYDGFKSPEHIGAPIPKMVERVKRWLADGRDVRIFTARACPGDKISAEEVAGVCAHIEAWCEEHIGKRLPITYAKDYQMFELWDDRAVQVIKNTGERADQANIDLFGKFTETMWFSGKPGEPTKEHDLPIMSLGLAGETGEALEHVKKFIRDNYLDLEAFKKELGDVVYYWARICRYFGLACSDVLRANIVKLESRRERGVQHGSGDNR